jgi:hypothetical protein
MRFGGDFDWYGLPNRPVRVCARRLLGAADRGRNCQPDWFPSVGPQPTNNQPTTIFIFDADNRPMKLP